MLVFFRFEKYQGYLSKMILSFKEYAKIFISEWYVRHLVQNYTGGEKVGDGMGRNDCSWQLLGDGYSLRSVVAFVFP